MPGKYLFVLSILGFILAITLPYIPFFANETGLVSLPFFQIGAMLIIVAFYIITADVLKVWFFKKYRNS